MKRLLLSLYILALGSFIIPPKIDAACCQADNGAGPCCGPCCTAGPTSCWAGQCS